MQKYETKLHYGEAEVRLCKLSVSVISAGWWGVEKRGAQLLLMFWIRRGAHMQLTQSQGEGRGRVSSLTECERSEILSEGEEQAMLYCEAHWCKELTGKEEG